MDTIRRCQIKLLDDRKLDLSVNVSLTKTRYCKDFFLNL